MQLEDLTKLTQLSYKVPGTYFNLVNFTPVIEYIHNNSVQKISEFDSEVKINNKQQRSTFFTTLYTVHVRF